MSARYLIVTGALILLTVVAGLVTKNTFALYTDQQVDGQTITIGTMDLKLSDGDETDEDDVSLTWELPDMKPGESETATLRLKNAGTLRADHVVLRLSNTVTEAENGPGSESSVPLDHVLQVERLTYDGGTDLKDQAPDANGNGIIDLDDLEGVVLDDLPLTDVDSDHEIAMTVVFHPSLAENQHHGDTVAFTLAATLHQVSSQ